MIRRTELRLDAPSRLNGLLQRFHPIIPSIMAIAIPHQPRYRDHSLPIYYLCGEQVRIRRRPTQIRDPRSEAQKAQRLRFKVASHFLAPFKSFVQKGFEPLEKENFRQVGAYQQALSHLLGYAIQQQGDVVKVDTQKVVLSEGRTNPMDTVQASVASGMLRVRWSGTLPKKCSLVLVAALNRANGEVLCRELEAEELGGGFSLKVPDDWNGAALDLWVAPWHHGNRGRFDSIHVMVDGVQPSGQEFLCARLKDLIPNRKGNSIRIASELRRRILIPDFYTGRRRRR